MNIPERLILAALVLVVGLLSYVTNDENVTFDEPGQVVDITEPHLDVRFLDIGQGDATLITFSNNEQMLVDCAIDARILEALGKNMKRGDWEIDYLVVTHPDLDHYGGCIDVLDRFSVKHIVYNGYPKGGEQHNEFLGAIEQERESGATYTIMNSVEEWEIGGAQIHFLYPDHQVTTTSTIPGKTSPASSNNTSIVMKITYGTQDVLLTGDAEADLESYLVKQYGEHLNVEVLKLSHHGSGSSSIEEFIAATRPDISVVSAGKNNRYGHPSLRVVKRIERVGGELFRTDEYGDILMLITTSTITIPSKRN